MACKGTSLNSVVYKNVSGNRFQIEKINDFSLYSTELVGLILHSVACARPGGESEHVPHTLRHNRHLFL